MFVLPFIANVNFLVRENSVTQLELSAKVTLQQFGIIMHCVLRIVTARRCPSPTATYWSSSERNGFKPLAKFLQRVVTPSWLSKSACCKCFATFLYVNWRAKALYKIYEFLLIETRKLKRSPRISSSKGIEVGHLNQVPMESPPGVLTIYLWINFWLYCCAMHIEPKDIQCFDAEGRLRKQPGKRNFLLIAFTREM